MIASLLVCLCISLSPVELYNQGNRDYEAGGFPEAIQAYEEAAEKTVNANVYYNLGNTYFQVKEIGKAILNYRRARILMPRDSDIRHNLLFVRNYRVDRIGIVRGPISELLSSVFHYFSVREASALTAFFFFLTFMLVSLLVIYRRRILGYAATITALLCVFSFITWRVWSSEVSGRPAVIVVPEVSALSGPGEDYKEILVLHDGAEVKVNETRGEYVLIHTPGGAGGWVRRDVLEEVFPRSRRELSS